MDIPTRTEGLSKKGLPCRGLSWLLSDSVLLGVRNKSSPLARCASLESRPPWIGATNFPFPGHLHGGPFCVAVGVCTQCSPAQGLAADV